MSLAEIKGERGSVSLDLRPFGWDTRARVAVASSAPLLVFFLRFSPAALCATRVIMRQLQMNIGTVGKTIVRQGFQLIVRVEVLRSLCANSGSALRLYASRLLRIARGAAWHEPSMVGMKHASVMACCPTPADMAAAGQHRRRHEIACLRTAAPMPSA